jgi:RimJ/RimL family protein N-acetyltransferase
MTHERLQEYVAARHDPARNRFPFAITLRADGNLIGDCGLTLLADEPGGAFLWYSVNRQYWGAGYATEAAATVVNFGLAVLKLSHIEARCHRNNHASLRVLEKIGMQRVTPGQSAPADHVEFSIRREKENNVP